MRGAGSALVMFLAVAVTSCGEGPAPAEPVPELSTRLAAVDAAVADRDYDAAQEALDELVGETEAALDAGDLGGTQAEAITVAAQRLSDEIADLTAATAQADPPEPPASPDPSTEVDGSDDPVDPP